MAKLIKFLDGKFGCWSRVELDNGDHIWISVARTGIMVKKSKWGLMGEKLYKANAYEAHQTAVALLAIYMHEGVPEENDLLNNMTNPILHAFTLAAMDSESASQLSVRLKSDLQALANEKSLQFKEKLDKYFGSSNSPLPGAELGNNALESVNEKASKSERNSRISFKQIQEKIINKKDADNIFSLNRKEWDNYVNLMVFPKGWKMRYEYNSVMAFDPNTHIGLRIQPLFQDDSSPPTTLIVGIYYPLGTPPAFTADIKAKLEKEAAEELGSQYFISATFVQTPPFEGIEVTIIDKYNK